MAGLTATPRWRGERNNNPLNVRWDGRTMWKGIDRAKPSDRDKAVHGEWGMARMLDPVSGLRMAARLLWNYQRLHGLRTIEGIVGRWAPPNENSTPKYVAHVADATGTDAAAPVDLRDRDFLARLMAAMIVMECGRNIYPDEMIREGIALAGIPKKDA